jgi:hypothetical protein
VFGHDAAGDDPVLDQNVCVVGDLSGDSIPFAVITPDGECHREGEMGFFGQSFENDAYWEDRWDELREKWKESVAVVLDCHV